MAGVADNLITVEEMASQPTFEILADDVLLTIDEYCIKYKRSPPDILPRQGRW